MFTGIIKELGTVLKMVSRTGGARLSIQSEDVGRDAAIGDSIAINGACLTVVAKEGNVLEFDLSGETMTVTDLGDLKSGDRVNLEPSLRAQDFMGGHFVSGHVEGIGVISEKRLVGSDILFKIIAPKELMDLTIKRGSICVDGISLTVTKVQTDLFETVIIPHTAAVTNLGIKDKGDRVNLEADLIARYIKRIIENSSPSDGSASINGLADKGFK